MTGRAVGFGLPLIGAVACLLGVLVAARALGPPDLTRTPPPDPGAGLRFQHVVAQIFLREAGLSRQVEPLELRASEMNAFLARHVEARRLALWPVRVRLEQDGLELAGRTSPRRLLAGSSTAWLAKILPAALLDLDVWLSVRGRIEVSPGRGRLIVERAAVGRQPIPPGWLWRLLGASPSELLVWRMPRSVVRLEVEPGRLVIHTRPGG